MDLTAAPSKVPPALWLPQARQAPLGDTRHWPHPRNTPAELKPLVRAFGHLHTRTDHQIGGHAVPVQGPVAYEIANATLGSMHPWEGRPLDQEAERSVLLAQFGRDSDARTNLGDEGTLYNRPSRPSQSQRRRSPERASGPSRRAGPPPGCGLWATDDPVAGLKLGPAGLVRHGPRRMARYREAWIYWSSGG
ncbi:hypothetical protein GCM10015535_41870 [Streptomyces gelaticus]|uniref:Uncharacterized protein n=1 Tax=Streptomyces gelaticus TaxID=285446 RepID=A0ABQ2W4G3_9ACTN|nr:hypothetical protein GCM10015535_41870 [Streptomyces gelaticus]